MKAAVMAGLIGLLSGGAILTQSAYAQSDTAPVLKAETLLSAPLRLDEPAALAEHAPVARREGNQLVLTYYAGTRHAQTVARLTDGDGVCQRYVFTGTKRLFSGYLHAMTDMAEVNCDNGDIAARFIQNDRGRLWTYTTSTATPDGRYLLAGGNPIYPDVPGATVFSVVHNIVNDGFHIACPTAEAVSGSLFRIDCVSFSGEAVLDGKWQIRIRRYAGDDRDSTAKTIEPYRGFITNGGDIFRDTALEAEQMAAFPGQAQRDGPDLVILEGKREVRRLTDAVSGCPDKSFRGSPNRFWFGGTVPLYDARARRPVPVAVVACQAGEFRIRMLVPARGEPYVAAQGATPSPDGRTLVKAYGSTEIVDWLSRKTLLAVPDACGSFRWTSNTRLEAECQSNLADRARTQIVFSRINGVWRADKTG
ncbi:MAG: hypothetical protein QM667_05265 [Asticcacaulis sp.]